MLRLFADCPERGSVQVIVIGLLAALLIVLAVPSLQQIDLEFASGARAESR